VALDLFWDLSDSGFNTPDQEALRGRHADTLIGFERVSVAVDGGDPPAEMLSEAITAAAARGHALAMVKGNWLPSLDALISLEALLATDPMIASAQPRFALPGTDRIAVLAATNGEPTAIPRDVLDWLPDDVLTPELPAACLVLSASAGIAAGETAAASSSDALAGLLHRARRRGFRNLVSNRIVVEYPLSESGIYPRRQGAGHGDTDADATADAERAGTWLENLPQVRFERIVAGAYSNERQRLLLDCRNLPSLHNGTSHAVLSMLRGFNAQARGTWEADVIVGTEAGAFHDIASYCPNLRVRDAPQGTYLAAVQLTQPWSFDTFEELHERAAIQLFYMYDTIAWDIIYAAPDGLGDVWHFAAAWADGLLFDSAFTRDRFSRRFPLRPEMTATVAHLSLSPDDWRVELSPADGARRPYVVVVGNPYDHKDVERTTRTLADAFPQVEIVSFGGSAGAAPHGVKAVPSGEVAQAELDKLLSDAAVIVYPSYYEGFGLPVAFGLANGRTVIVRSSPLWTEIAGRSWSPGILATFTDAAELVDAVRRTLAGEIPQQVLTQGGDLVGEPAPGWEACALTILAAVTETIKRADAKLWLERDAVLAAVRAERDGVVAARAAEIESTRAEFEAAVGTAEADRDRTMLQLQTVTRERELLELERRRLSEERDHVAAQAQAAWAESEKWHSNLEAAYKDGARAQREIDATYSSLSWRITRPLRTAGALARRLRRRG
jgi:glycosyltransferase involved in cell wall biosynthesis